MSEVPGWLALAAAAVMPCVAIIGFWMSISSRLTKSEVNAENASKSASEANEKVVVLSAASGLFREQVARNYIHREAMREVEDRLTQAIDRLGDRLDRVLGLVSK